MLNWSIDQTVRFISEPSLFDEMCYANAVSEAILALKNRENGTDVSISDFIERYFISSRLFHIMNHPAAFILEELANRILEKTNISNRTRAPSFLFSESELLSAWHPENPYLRQKHGFQFSGARVYKGVRLVRADTPLGFVSAGPKIYNEKEFVEAMYAFYEYHAVVLKQHPRVKQALARYQQTI